MKNLFKIIAPAALLVLASACVNDYEYEVPGGKTRTLHYTATFDAPSTKTTLSGSGSTRNVAWVVGDQISYLTDEPNATVGTYTIAANTDNTPSYHLTFENISFDALFINAFYGASQVSAINESSFGLRGVVPAQQSWTSFAEAHTSAAHEEITGVDNATMHFQNVVGIMKFTSAPSVYTIEIEGSDGETIASRNGSVKVYFTDNVLTNVEAASASNIITVNTEGQSKDFYVAVIPTYFEHGFTVKCYDENNELLKTKHTYKSVELGRKADGTLSSKLINLGSVQEWLDSADPIVPTNPVQSISLNKTQFTVKAGQSFQLSATVTPADADTTTVSWSTSNGTIATVNSNGFVETLKEGEVDITATTNMKLTIAGHPLSASCHVIVEDAVEDLSENGTANCYIAPAENTKYKFLATVKGNSSEALDGTPASVCVLWESRPATDSGISSFNAGDVVSLSSSDLKLKGDYVYFKSKGQGSALIAVKNASGEILWSWHIWVWPGFSESANSQTYFRNAGVAMDRDLGAETSYPTRIGDWRCWGLVYQWGRKDPFFGRETRASIAYDDAHNPQYTYEDKAPRAIMPEPLVSDSAKGTVSWTVKNPTTYLLYPTNNYQDWHYGSRDNTLWGGSKTKYDPCPPGWKLPGGNFWYIGLGVSSNIYNNISTVSIQGLDFSGYLSNDAHVFYPASGGFLGTVDYSYYHIMEGKTYYGYWWTGGCTADAGTLLSINRQSKQVLTRDTGARACGYSVRCVKDGSAPVITPDPVNVTSITLDKTELELAVGKNYQLTATVLPSAADDKTVTWKSNDESVVSVVNGLVTALKEGNTTITVTSKMVNTVTATCQVTVTPATEVDLSANGSANCYLVTGSGDYRFKAVKGNSAVAVTPTSVDILWQGYGTADPFNSVLPVVEYDVNKKVTYSNGYIYFTIPSTMTNGNAVIAAFDANNKVLWSWHIWAVKGYDADASAQTYYNNAGVVMDRNLGATSNTPGSAASMGLYYQWGRKDPFPASYAIQGGYNGAPVSPTSASTGADPTKVFKDVSIGASIDYAVQNPMTFILSSGGNWLSQNNPNLWNSTSNTKTIYDPCPPGWRVPIGGSNGLWQKAIKSSGTVTVDTSVNYGVSYSKFFCDPVVWFQYSGFKYCGTGLIDGVGGDLYVWSANQYGNNAAKGSSFCQDRSPSFYYTDNGFNKANGAVVRCVKE